MYKNHIKGPIWQTKRSDVRNRCNGICERCALYAMDDVHHLTYDNLFFEPLEDLWGLCRGCHKFVHGLSSIDPDESGYWLTLENRKKCKLTPREINDAMSKRERLKRKRHIVPY